MYLFDIFFLLLHANQQDSASYSPATFYSLNPTEVVITTKLHFLIFVPSITADFYYYKILVFSFETLSLLLSPISSQWHTMSIHIPQLRGPDFQASKHKARGFSSSQWWEWSSLTAQYNTPQLLLQTLAWQVPGEQVLKLNGLNNLKT